MPTVALYEFNVQIRTQAIGNARRFVLPELFTVFQVPGDDLQLRGLAPIGNSIICDHFDIGYKNFLALPLDSRRLR